MEHSEFLKQISFSIYFTHSKVQAHHRKTEENYFLMPWKIQKPEFIATLISLSRTTPFNRTNFSTNVKFNNHYFLVAYIYGKIYCKMMFFRWFLLSIPLRLSRKKIFYFLAAYFCYSLRYTYWHISLWLHNNIFLLWTWSNICMWIRKLQFVMVQY